MRSLTGMRMPSWFDLATLDKLTDSQYDDERGLLQSIAAVDSLIQAEVDAGIPEDKIFLGGFSQGGAVAVYGGLTSKRRLGGIVGLSTWIPLNHKVPQVSEKPSERSERGSSPDTIHRTTCPPPRLRLVSCIG